MYLKSNRTYPVRVSWEWVQYRKFLQRPLDNTIKGEYICLLLCLPIDCGATMCTNPAENRMRQKGSETHARYWRTGWVARSRYNQILPIKSIILLVKRMSHICKKLPRVLPTSACRKYKWNMQYAAKYYNYNGQNQSIFNSLAHIQWD